MARMHQAMQTLRRQYPTQTQAFSYFFQKAESGTALRVSIIAAESEEEAAAKGVALVLKGEVFGLMKGWIHTDVLMHPVLAHLRTARRISHVFVAELLTYPKLLYITDAAINIAPDLKHKAAIVQNAVDLARLLGVSLPKVAALSSVEIVDGPLAFDNAISKEAARIKGIDSEVANEVDILLVPDLDVGNILASVDAASFPSNGL